jgi:hypothetical protein
MMSAIAVATGERYIESGIGKLLAVDENTKLLCRLSCTMPLSVSDRR